MAFSCQMVISLIFRIKRPIKPNQDKNFTYLTVLLFQYNATKEKKIYEAKENIINSRQNLKWILIHPSVFNIKTITALKVFLCWCSFVWFPCVMYGMRVVIYYTRMKHRRTKKNIIPWFPIDIQLHWTECWTFIV